MDTNTSNPYGSAYDASNTSGLSNDQMLARNNQISNVLGDDQSAKIYQNNAAAYHSDNLDQSRRYANALGSSPYAAASPYAHINTAAAQANVATTQLGAAGQAQGMYGPSQLQVDGSALAPQQQLLQAMAARSQGSLGTNAQMQLAQGNQAALAQQQAVASTMQRGANAGLLQRQYAQSAADAGQNTLQAQQMLRAQEMTQGQQQMASYLGSGQQQNIGLAQNNAALQHQGAQMQQDVGQYNAGQQNQFALNQGNLTQQQMLTQAQMQNAGADRSQAAQMANQNYAITGNQQQQARQFGALGIQSDIDRQNLQSQMLLDQARQNSYQQAFGTQAGVYAGNQQLTGNMVGAGIAGAGTAAAQLLTQPGKVVP